MKNANGENFFEIQNYLGCAGVELYSPQYIYNNNNNGNSSSYKNLYFFGLTCTENNVMLTGFYDEKCKYEVERESLENAMGSYQYIPFLDGTPVFAAGQCLACVEDDVEFEYNADFDDNGENGNQNIDGDGDGDADQWKEEHPDATGLCMMATGQDGGNAIVCDDFDQTGCDYIRMCLPKMNGRGDALMTSIANLRNRLTRSKRACYVLGAVAAILLAFIVYYGQFWCLGRRVPKHRDALLRYRREGDASMNSELL